jgi:hypothetical protein
MTRNRTKLPKENLIKFSYEHLYYEIWMLYRICDILINGVADKCIENALLESHIMHARIILDFLYGKVRYDDDARIEDYMDNVSEWQSMLPPKDTLLEQIYQRGHKEIVHLSYKRLEVAPDKKQWEFYKITKAIMQRVNLFLDKANPELLDQKMYTLRS